MKTKWKCALRFLILFIAFFFQSSPVIEKISLDGVTPNLLFVLLFVYSLYLKDGEVVTYTLIFGSATDLLFGKIYGVTTLLMLAFTCIYILLNKYIYAESRIVVGIYCMLASLTYETALLIINAAIWQENAFFAQTIKMILIKALYNAVIAIPAFYIARRMHRLSQEVRL